MYDVYINLLFRLYELITNGTKKKVQIIKYDTHELVYSFRHSYRYTRLLVQTTGSCKPIGNVVRRVSLSISTL